MEPNQNTDENSLETPETPAESTNSAAQTTGAITQAPAAIPEAPKKPSLSKRIQSVISRVNVYLLLFVLILVLASGIVFVGYQRTKKQGTITQVNTQPLDEATLEQLNGSDTVVGDPKQTLSVESNAVFSGKVLIRDSLDVAGAIKVGGSLNLPGITVSGTSNFDQIIANRLSIAGDLSVQGIMSIQRNLTVSGSGTFGGPISAPQLTVQTLALNNDIQLNRHIDAGGPTPGQTNLTLGGGGTASVSGSDTAGTVNINYTGGASANACFIRVNFAARFNGTPHVIITPNNFASAKNLKYYVNDRSATGFQICAADVTGNGTYAFDYIVID